MAPLKITPPILNSANPWCTTLEQLLELYESAYSGAITTRTSLLNGFPHNREIHQFTFYDPTSHDTSPPNIDQAGKPGDTGSLNTLGYSPIPLEDYLDFIKTISRSLPSRPEGEREHFKPVVISVTGSAEEVVSCYKLISSCQRDVRMVLAMEINLSCPNIPDKPPPAYNSASLLTYLAALKTEIERQISVDGTSAHPHTGHIHVPIGIKTPPYTYQDQYNGLIKALKDSAYAEPEHLPCPITFITSCNTLGSSLLLAPQVESSSDGQSHEVYHRVLESATGTGIGGLAGAPLHPLALGNVYTIKGLLFQHKELEQIQIIGVGGVEDAAGYGRMLAVGAAAVGVGTALGRKGVKIFQEIGQELAASAT
ncbi:FMN-linked oxidoreductase [Didymella exigua CBS 183.55]|uniref:Dihydroorotate dehydrogenase (fumarate) n=1 Tax=Didymella exigua CBS 183.55 TaxID=1150837 RepID=A0A6A5RUH9_9PLEO|nr:FMN-linked oxidoreductase [Didymella exigua CBS 183.55]KAF1930814.1 FMN-linked oxidoreductase [Didymella exigua CBS 183.55]